MDLALKNLQWFIYDKAKPNQPKPCGVLAKVPDYDPQVN